MDNSQFDLKFIKETNTKHFFDAENDRYKKKKLLYNSFAKPNSFEFDSQTIYPYILADTYNRYYKMNGYNVLYMTGLNNLSFSSYQFSKNHNIDYLESGKKYREAIDNLNIGYDSHYFFNLSDKKIVSLMDDFFKRHYKKDIFYDNIDVYSTSIKDRYYNHFEIKEENNRFYSKYTNEELFKTKAKVFYLDIKKYEDKIREEINNLDLDLKYKNEILSLLGDYQNIVVPFNISKDLKLDIELSHPEYMAGISFIALNPKYMDVLPFVSEEEYNLVYKFMQNGYEDGKFSGLFCKNPLNYNDICIMISYNFEEAIHVGIPEISDIDKEFCNKFGLEYLLITSNNHLIHSDFLDGLTPIDARKTIIDAFSNEGACEVINHFRQDKIIISSTDETGAPIPFEITKDGFDYSVLESQYYPLLYNRFGKVIYGKTPSYPVELVNLTFNNLYQTSILRMFLQNKDNYYSFQDFLNYEEDFIYESELANEILFPLIFNIIDSNEIRKIKYHIMLEEYPDYQLINENNNLNIHFVSDVLTRCSRDALRFYILQHPNDTNFEESILKINKIDKFLEDVYTKYYEGFSDVNMELDNTMYDLVNDLTNDINNLRIDLYVSKLEYVFNNKIRNKKWTEDEALIYLKLLSIVCPFITEFLFENVFNQHNYIIFEEWPKY